MSQFVACHDCRIRFNCICGPRPDGSYYHDWKHHSHFGLGAIRCHACCEKFKEANRQEKMQKEALRMKNHLESNHEDGEVCEECCEHEFDPSEGFTCLNCGKDGAEDAMANAYDRAKDLSKYG